MQTGSAVTSLAGDDLNTIVELVPAADYDTARNRLLDDLRSRTGRNVIGLLARANPDLDDLANEIYRSQRIAELHRNEPIKRSATIAQDSSIGPLSLQFSCRVRSNRLCRADRSFFAARQPRSRQST